MKTSSRKRKSLQSATGDFRDLEIRRELTRVLLQEHQFSADTLVIEEFGCNDARADMAVVNGRMHCYEIKSRFDKLDRLANQIPAYSAVFDRVTIVLAHSHFEKASRVIPSWWGITVVVERDGKLALRKQRLGKANPAPSSRALARMLWKDDAIRLLRDNSLGKQLKSATVERIWQAVEDGLPTKIISQAVRTAIKRRGGSGFRPPLLRSDDSFPRQSSFPHFPVPQ